MTNFQKQKQYQQNNMYVRYYKTNDKGRDFVVGDIHGTITELEVGLEHLNFDPAVDRVFSVGDLIDRGIESKKSLQLLDNPWFDATLGNHEQMMRQALQDGDYSAAWGDWMHNGGAKWARNESDETLQQLVNDYIVQMPYVIVVGKDTPGRFNVVHAQLHAFSRYDVTDAVIDSWVDPDPEFAHHFRLYAFPSNETWDRCYKENTPLVLENGMLWDRTLAQAASYTVLGEKPARREGLSTTFAGHTPMKSVAKIASHIYIDTGSIYAASGSAGDSTYGLTIVEPATGKFINVNRARQGRVGDAVIREGVL